MASTVLPHPLMAGSRERPSTHHGSVYRGDIDGLRALSVLAVILFHLVPTHFPAGGLGVDVFFVISGYLVGGGVMRDVAAGSFRLGDFYLRRVRRIAPAFMFTLLATSAAAWIWLYPDELKRFAWTTLTALACSSNFWFAAHSGYFDADSELLPLLHTWTLGVEEQFYFLFPALALAAGWLARSGRIRTAIIIAVALASLVLSQYQVHTNASAAFYLLPSRGWELLLGVVAERAPPWLFAAAWQRVLACVAGIAMVLVSFYVVQPANGFPGVVVLPSCLGAALVLASGQNASSLAHRALAIWPARMVGQASYSLYLWHWPIIVFWKYHSLTGKLQPDTIAWLLLVIMVVGFLSWRFLERPFRNRGFGVRRLLVTMAALAALIGAIQLFALATRGAPFRYSPSALAIAAQPTENRIIGPSARCFLIQSEPLEDYDRARCLGTRPGSPSWLLVGDSHAAMLYHGLQTRFPDINLQSAVGHGCDLRIHAPVSDMLCDNLAHLVFSEYLPKARIAGVILTSRWQLLRPADLRSLGATLHKRGQELIVIGPAPEYSMTASRIAAEAIVRNKPELTEQLVDPAIWQRDADLEAGSNNAYLYVSLLKPLCPGRRYCTITDARGRSLYLDGNHYTPEGSVFAMNRAVTDRMRQLLQHAHDSPP